MKNKNVDKIRSWLLQTAVEIIKPVYAVLFQRDKKPWNQTLESLKNHPPKTLGWELGHFLERHGFDLIPLYENHDVYHVVLNYEPEVVDEAAMQFFLLGNRKITVSVLITVVFATLILPKHLGYFIKEYRRGRNSLQIKYWNFQHLLNEPLEVLQNQIFKHKNAPPVSIF